MGDTTDIRALEALAGRVVDIAAQAGSRIVQVSSADFPVSEKQDRSPLTLADLASHELICARLLELTPEIPILSEESSGIGFEQRRCWPRFWLVDPLDGTKEFISRNGQYTVNIALIDGHRPVLGVVHVPAAGLTYYAWEGGGAFLRDAGGPRPIHARRTDANRLALAGSRSHATPEQQRFFAACGDGIEVLSLGSALKFCLVAEGKVDLYPRFGPTSEWDTAAAHCVVEQAGGSVTTLDFRPLQYNTRPALLNPHFLAMGDPQFDWRPYLVRAGLA